MGLGRCVLFCILTLTALFCLLPCAQQTRAQQPPAQAPDPQPTQRKPDPGLLHRPPPKAPSLVIPTGKIFLDAIVTDTAGKPIAGLQPWDFKLLDNDHPTKILSFRSYDGVTVRPDPPVQVILLIDELNLPITEISFVRSQLAAFLRQNNGHLAQPVTIFLLTETGLQVQPRPSTDGNALLGVLNQIKPHISSISPAMGSEGALERTQISVRQLAAIAENEARKPGRKLLLWIGPGWPMLQSRNFEFNERDRRADFDLIVELTNRLREARMVLYSVAPLDSAMGAGTHDVLYQAFLKGVRAEQQADVGNLALKVLVTNTGGKILGPDNDLTGQMNQCIADANAFYSLSFNPPQADHAGEFHQLSLAIDQAGALVRTNTAYYTEPPGN